MDPCGEERYKITAYYVGFLNVIYAPNYVFWQLTDSVYAANLCFIVTCFMLFLITAPALKKRVEFVNAVYDALYRAVTWQEATWCDKLLADIWTSVQVPNESTHFMINHEILPMYVLYGTCDIISSYEQCLVTAAGSAWFQAAPLMLRWFQEAKASSIDGKRYHMINAMKYTSSLLTLAISTW